MYPHERSLVKQYKDRPFALLGVDVGDKPELLHKLVDNNTLTWRFWVEPGSRTTMSRYQVDGFPMLFLLDHKGVIRDVGLRDEGEIKLRIEELVRDAEQATSSS
jgi:hypothetical protein